MKHVNKVSSTAVQITGCLISYPHLFEAKQVQNKGDFKFSANFIFPASMDAEDWETINAIVEQVVRAKWPGGAPANMSMPWKEGGDADASLAGRVMVSASAKADSRPAVVIEDGRTPAPPGSVYPGMGVNAYLNIFAYDAGVNRGVSFGLNGVQIADRTTKRLDGRKAAEEVFSAVAAPAGAPPPVAPVPHAPTPAFPGAPQAPQPAPVPGPAAAGPVAPGAPSAWNS